MSRSPPTAWAQFSVRSSAKIAEKEKESVSSQNKLNRLNEQYGGHGRPWE